MILDELRDMGFIASDRFWSLDPCCWGGCGPGKWGDYFVPDKLFNTDIKPACAAHDVSWEIAVEAENLDLKYRGDFEFLINQRKLIERDKSQTVWVIHWLKGWFANFYFNRVWEHIPRKLKGRESYDADRLQDLYRYYSLGGRRHHRSIFLPRVVALLAFRAFDGYWRIAGGHRGDR